MQDNVPPDASACGGMVSPVTPTDAVLVQPFAPPTVTVYKPGADTSGDCIADVKPPGPFHENTIPACVLTDTVTTGVGHPISPETETEKPGGTKLATTVVVATVVQPFAGFVTVTLYKPPTAASVSATDAVKLFGPLHRKVAPVVLVLTCIAAAGAAQVMVSLRACAAGGVVLDCTDVDALAVQPFEDVTVTL